MAFDAELPWHGIIGSLEGVVTRVNEAIYYQQLNLGAPTAVGQDGRQIYWNAVGRNRANWDNQGRVSGNALARANSDQRFNDAIIARPTSEGATQSFTVGLNKPFNDSDWSWSLAYTYSNAKEVSGLTSSTSGSQLLNTAAFQANEEVNATSAYEIKDSFLGTLQWKHNFFGDYATKLGLVYQGRSGRPYSYTFDNDANGDGRANDLLYIPKGRGDVLFGSAAEENAFWNYVNNDQYLSTHQGQLAGRNAVRNSWVNQFDLHIEQELPGFRWQQSADLA